MNVARCSALVLGLLVGCFSGVVAPRAILAEEGDAAQSSRPVNILFAIADDWGPHHAGAYGDPAVKTPTFDRIAREGVLFNNAFCTTPSCTPSRSAILSGQYPWRLDSGANLYAVFGNRFTTYPELLKMTGYQLGVSGKGWGPGSVERRGRQLIGPRYEDFPAFLKSRDTAKPFCYWLGSGDPHRAFVLGSGAAGGVELSKIRVPGYFPDNETVRGDMADYYFAVQRFDTLVGEALAALEAAGELDNTLVVMTSDHGMPFPRAKSNLYDAGMRVPLAIRWPAHGKAGRTVEDFVNLADMAPTFLEAAGMHPPARMTGQSLMTVLQSSESGQVDPERNIAFFGKERHVAAQARPDWGGYPCRAVRTKDYLYIRNYRPDRWPAGTPDYRRASMPGGWYADCDNGPTKRYIVENREQDAAHRRIYELSFGKRPAEELYILANDPEQLTNVAESADYAQVKADLAARLTAELVASEDPREIGGGEKFDRYEYVGGAPRYDER